MSPSSSAARSVPVTTLRPPRRRTTRWIGVALPVAAAVALSTACLHPLPIPPGDGNPVPGDTSTGVPAGTVLSTSGGFTVTTAGAVIDAKDITGTVTIAAPNVTIKRCRFTGNGGDWGVYVQSGSVLIEDSEFTGSYHTAAIGMDNWTALRVDIHGVPDDGVKLGSHTLLQDSWLHDFSPEGGAHADGVQMQNGVTNARVVHNAIDVAGNAAVFLAPDLGPSTAGPVTVQDNLLGGGNYTLYVVDGNNGQYTVGNITIADNAFLRDARYGPVEKNVPATWTNNTYLDTGAVINP